MKNKVVMLLFGAIILGILWAPGCKTSGESVNSAESPIMDTVSGTWEISKSWDNNLTTFILTFVGQQVIRNSIPYEEGDVYLNNEKVGTYSLEPCRQNHPCSNWCLIFIVIVERYETTEVLLTQGNSTMKGTFKDDQNVVEGTWSAHKL